MVNRPVLLMIVLALASPVEEGFVPLFDGKSLAGWISVVGNPGDWKAEDGRLVAGGAGKG